MAHCGPISSASKDCRPLVILAIAALDLVSARLLMSEGISHSAHAGGSVAGFLMAVPLARNLRMESGEKASQGIAGSSRSSERTSTKMIGNVSAVGRALACLNGSGSPTSKTLHWKCVQRGAGTTTSASDISAESVYKLDCTGSVDRACAAGQCTASTATSHVGLKDHSTRWM